MNRLIKIRPLIIAILIFLVTPGQTIAGTGSRALNISTRVVQFLKYSILHQEINLVLGEADIERGYVDISRGMVLSVRSNSNNGYLVWFSTDSALLGDVTVFSENNAYRLSRSGNEVHMPFQGNNFSQKELSFRFHLSEDAVPGTYQWPVAVMLTTI